MAHADLESVSEIHRAAFVRQKMSLEWIRCNFNAFPKVQYFVAENNTGHISGFIQWTQKSGFREEVVLELEQIAVHPDFQGRGIGRVLILESLPIVQKNLRERGALLKHILVTTRSDNFAQRLYQSTMGAEVECTVKNLYSHDEVFMIARNVDRDPHRG